MVSCHGLPKSAAPQLSPAPTAVQATGPFGLGWRVAQAAGREAEPRLPVIAVSLQMRSGGNQSFRPSRAGIRPLPPCATTAAKSATARPLLRATSETL